MDDILNEAKEFKATAIVRRKKMKGEKGKTRTMPHSDVGDVGSNVKGNSCCCCCCCCSCLIVVWFEFEEEEEEEGEGEEGGRR